jgi:hypothetical protein
MTHESSALCWINWASKFRPRSRRGQGVRHDRFASDLVAAVSFCRGVLVGACSFHPAAKPAADRVLCTPNPAPTRTRVANGIVAWLKSRLKHSNDGAIDALLRCTAETGSCRG